METIWNVPNDGHVKSDEIASEFSHFIDLNFSMEDNAQGLQFAAIKANY